MEEKIKKSGKRSIRRKKIQRIKRLVRTIVLLLILTIVIIIIICNHNKKNKETSSDEVADVQENIVQNNITDEENKIQENNTINEENNILENNTIDESENNEDDEKDLGWELTLANKEHKMPEDYEIELKSIDEYREIDERVYEYYWDMIDDMREDGIQNIWAQSTYRSIKTQEKIFNDKVKYYKSLGKTQKQAEELTEKSIMRPGCSDHNLGLAIDFNNVDQNFEDLKGFKWLQENAEDYGFVLRYPKEKEDITKVKYEPWHWRYVGIENAKEMNKKDMCLEEYVEYLQSK